jgi:hypothetical protein
MGPGDPGLPGSHGRTLQIFLQCMPALAAVIPDFTAIAEVTTAYGNIHFYRKSAMYAFSYKLVIFVHDQWYVA